MDDLIGKRVEELWDREMIKELTYAYGRCIEQQNAEGMAKARIVTEKQVRTRS